MMSYRAVARGEGMSAYAGQTMMEIIGRLFCWLGIHDFRVVDVTLAFGAGGAVETVECRRCGLRTTRSGRSRS